MSINNWNTYIPSKYSVPKGHLCEEILEFIFCSDLSNFTWFVSWYVFCQWLIEYTSIVNDRNGKNQFRPKPKFRSTLPKIRPKFRPKLAPNFSPILAKNCHQKLLLRKIQMTSYIFWSMKLIHVYLIYHCFITKMNQNLYWNFKIGKLWRKLPNRVI